MMAERMTCGIHQPHFLPWMGYFNKVWHSDVFVWLHSVQYRRSYYQNRAKIKINEQAAWLTLPVHAPFGANIDEVVLATSNWRSAVTKTVQATYGRTPHFTSCWPVLADAMNRASDTLDDVNYQTFVALLNLLEMDHVRVVRAGEIPVDTTDPTERLVQTCKHLGVTRYIAGKGGHNYLELEQFDRAGIEIVWQDFDFNQIVYPQAGKNFVPGLSLIDCLFNVGPTATRDLVRDAWTPG